MVIKTNLYNYTKTISLSAQGKGTNKKKYDYYNYSDNTKIINKDDKLYDNNNDFRFVHKNTNCQISMLLIWYKNFIC